VPTVRLSRTIAAPPAGVWELIADPHHLPRWWPRVVRVEAVQEDAFTEVLRSDRGRTVRADFRLVQAQPPTRIVWSQEIGGTPFARVLRSAEVEIALADGAPDAGAVGAQPRTGTGAPPPRAATEVTIELRQALRGLFARLGARFVRRAATATIKEALDGLERIVAPAP
jgi:uncharacterized protein YndB with AHSA1/START domain